MMCCNRAAHSRLNHVKSHWLNPVMFSGVACQLCLWDIGEKVIVYIQTCILCNFNICVKHLALFHMSRMLVEDNQNVASLEKYRLSKGGNANNQNWKGKKKKYGETAIWCYFGEFDGGSCGYVAVVREQNYGVGSVGGYGAVGGRVCSRHQNIFKLMSCLNFSQL